MTRHRNPTTWAATILASQPMQSAVATEVMAKLYSAFADLKAGSTDDELFDRLASAINIGMIRAEKIDPLCEVPMLAARDALIRSDELRGRHGHYGFDGPGLQAMTIGLETYEAILRASTPNQMAEATQESFRRMQRQVAQEGREG